MLVGCNVPDFTQRPLAVSTEQRNEGTKLVPTRLQLTPLLQVFILLTRLVEELPPWSIPQKGTPDIE